MTVAGEAAEPVRLAAAIAAELRAHPSVAGLGAGHLGAIATHGPNRKVIGVRVPGLGELVEIGVVLWLQQRLLAPVADELRPLVRALAGDVEVSIEIVDVAVPDAPIEVPAPTRQAKRKRARS